jgi:hypothetical protein
LFGEQVNFANGALSFSATDASLPGNNGLPVAVKRTFSVSGRYTELSDLPFGDWDLDLPHLSGVFGGAAGWAGPCTSASPPPVVNSSGAYFYANEYWHGNQASLPTGGGEMLSLSSTTYPRPASGGPYYWVTPDFTYFACLPTSPNRPDTQGFLAVAPDGTKYRFDVHASYYEPEFTRPEPANPGGVSGMPRQRAVLYPSSIEDRFGNKVTYTFANAWNAPARLTNIDSSDGRHVTLLYYAGTNLVEKVNDGTRVWTYQYAFPSPLTATLASVTMTSSTLPGSRRWVYDFDAFLTAEITYETGQPGDPVRNCSSPGLVFDRSERSGTITHPSGAVGEFSVKPHRFGRTNVPMACNRYTSPNNDPNDDSAVYPMNYDAYAVNRKKVSGPALATREWTYAYAVPTSFAAGTGPVCTSGDCAAVRCISETCAGRSTTTITNPDDSWTRYTFGNSYRYNEGKLLKVENGSATGVVEKSETTDYIWPLAGEPFTTPIGNSLLTRGDGFTAEYLRPQFRRVIAQDAETFSSEVESFDAFAHPERVSKFSSLGYSKIDTTEYLATPASKWIIGQVKRVVNADDGKVISQTDYDSVTAAPLKTYSFDKLQQTLTYYSGADATQTGTIATVIDGNNKVTELKSWHRGIPGTIVYPDTPESPTGATESAAISNNGWINSSTDENGYMTGYTYDVAGMVTKVTQPTGDSVAWNVTTQSFAPVATAKYGIPTGHWMQTISTGAARRITYFDTLWRPLVVESYDDTDAAATRSINVSRYDTAGHVAYQSYPLQTLADYAAVTQGTRTFYDVLDRVTRVEQDSELGPLVTKTEYLDGFKRRITNPRSIATTQFFQAYDQPAYDAPVEIDAPEGASTLIARDRYLKPLEVIRSGPDG